MGIYTTFKTDRKAEAEGFWYQVGVNDDGTTPSFLLARMSKNNPRYAAAMERVGREIMPSIELGTLTDSEADPILMKVFVTTVLLDWRDIQGPDGVELKFSEETALKVMTDLPDLYILLSAEAKKLSNYRNEAATDKLVKKS